VPAWGSVPLGPPDKIFGLIDAFSKDSDPRKQSLVVGAYRTDKGKPWVLPSIRKAEEKVMEDRMNKEYTKIDGVPEYVDVARKFAFGKDSPALAENRIASVQSLSGTGSLRLIGDFYAKFIGNNAPLYLPKPTWANHTNIFRDAGLDVREYRYWDPATLGLDLEGMLEDLRAAPCGSVVLLHAVAHNPTGVDPTNEQWLRICAEIKARGTDLNVCMDSAYQGFASGDAEADAFAVRHFVSEGVPFSLAQSFAKNCGLYGERVGLVSFVCDDADEATRVLSQLKILIRPMYSSPPVHGARIVTAVLSDPAIEAQWRSECREMAERIIAMRTAFFAEMGATGTTRKWNHIVDQIGMFCFTGLTTEQVARLRDEFHIYLTTDGRISMAGVTTANVKYIAESFHAVTKD